MSLLTVGYQGVDIVEFVDALKRERVDTIVDVRELPLSRKPGYSKSPLSDALRAANISYIHVRALGCPKEIRSRLSAEKNWMAYKDAFCRYLSSLSVEVALVAKLANKNAVCLLCFEADYNECHRRFVAEAIAKKLKMPVRHLVIRKATAAREYLAAA